MKYIDEFRDKKLADKLLAEINRTGVKRASFMEVCGTHTTAIFRSGLREILGSRITLISGPGCPVCVTAQSDIDRMISLAGRKDVILTTFGDMLKVPGTHSSLEKERAAGADIRVVYSPADALEIARSEKNRHVIFLAVGFETTSPIVASVVSDAAQRRTDNFSIYCSHKFITPAMRALLETGEICLDGFICPGHVSSIIGSKAYGFIPLQYGLPCVIAGFEPVDILESILLLLRQLRANRAEVEIQYSRAVRPGGNLIAQRLLKEVFEPCDGQWRGLGIIPLSACKLRKEFARFDAEKRFTIKTARPAENPRCCCAKVLRGMITPNQCGLFAAACTPENPFGPCMVSTEGACAAWYAYNRPARITGTK
jgi:hydrogenase expression/formation protein HypD